MCDAQQVEVKLLGKFSHLVGRVREREGVGLGAKRYIQVQLEQRVLRIKAKRLTTCKR